MVPFDRLGMVSLCSVVTFALSRTTFEIFDYSVRFGVSHTCIRCVVQITFLRCLSLFLQLRTVFTVESVGYGL